MIGTPHVQVFSLLFPILYYLSMDIPILLISVFPPQARNFFTIGLCLSWDFLTISTILSWALYFIFTVSSFVLTFNDSMDCILKRLSRSSKIIPPFFPFKSIEKVLVFFIFGCTTLCCEFSEKGRLEIHPHYSKKLLGLFENWNFT